MVIVDTNALVFDALTPDRLSRRAARTIEHAAKEGVLACSDISLWEIAMLIAKGRLTVSAEPALFLERLIQARAVTVLPITPEIAVLANSAVIEHGDPADRVIAGTAIHHRAKLVTSDAKLQSVEGLTTVW